MPTEVGVAPANSRPPQEAGLHKVDPPQIAAQRYARRRPGKLSGTVVQEARKEGRKEGRKNGKRRKQIDDKIIPNHTYQIAVLSSCSGSETLFSLAFVRGAAQRCLRNLLHRLANELQVESKTSATRCSCDWATWLCLTQRRPLLQVLQVAPNPPSTLRSSIVDTPCHLQSPTTTVFGCRMT